LFLLPQTWKSFPMSEKKLFVHPNNKGLEYKLYHRGEDMTCRWNITYQKDGKRIQVRAGINRGKSYAERYALAMDVLKKLFAEHRNDLPPCKIRAGVEQYVVRMSATWRPKTVMAYKQVVREYFHHLNGRRPTTKNTEVFTAKMQKNLAPNTYTKRITFLRKLVNPEGDAWVLADTPKLKASPQSLRYFQINHRAQLVAYMEEKDPELLLFTQFIYYCFLRPKEIRFLKVSDILWDSMKIQVRTEVAKNGRAQYAIIPDEFEAIIKKKYLMRPPGEYLFTRKRDKTLPISYNTMSRRFRIILDYFGYGREFALYSWKHTGTVNAYKAGVRIKELMSLLRHASLDYTDRYLSSLGLEDQSNFRKVMPPMNEMPPT
jgi:integrase